MKDKRFIKLNDYKRLSIEEMECKSENYFKDISRRRSVRTFSSESFPIEIIKNCIRSAGSAPSGANMQPWHFVVVTKPDLKKKIREAAEKEEIKFYGGKASQAWLDALKPLGTDFNKPFLEYAPYLIVIFEKN